MSTSAGSSKDLTPTREDFAALLSETMSEDDVFEGSVVKADKNWPGLVSKSGT